MEIHAALRGDSWSSILPTATHRLEAGELGAITTALALRPHLWRPLARHQPGEPWCERVALTPTVEVWLVGWLPGQYTRLHDHRATAGALEVVAGTLVEIGADGGPGGSRTRLLRPGRAVSLPPSTVHRVGNAGTVPATSIHAYSPPAPPASGRARVAAGTAGAGPGG